MCAQHEGGLCDGKGEKNIWKWDNKYTLRTLETRTQ